MNKIRVVHLIGSLGLGGPSRLLTSLIKYLPKDQVETIILSFRGENEMLIKELRSLGVTVETLRIRNKFVLKGFLLILSAFIRIQPDIVHCHTPRPWRYGLPSGWLAFVPVRIAHLHNTNLWGHQISRLFDSFIFQFAHAILGCSKAVLCYCKENIRCSEQKLFLVYNGVDINSFYKFHITKEEAKKSLGFSQDEIIITTVASLVPQKGHEYLIRAIPKVTASYSKVHFLFVGSGVLRGFLESLANRLRVNERVIFLGERLDVPIILAASDIFVLPSLWEGFGIALVEAGLMGLPVVASRVDGIVEVVEDGRSGFLVPPKDPEALAEAIITLIRDPALREQMGKIGRQICLERFDISKTAHKIMKLYERFLSEIKSKY